MIRRWASPVAASVSLHIAGAALFVTLMATFYSARPRLSLPPGGVAGIDVRVDHDESALDVPTPATGVPADVQPPDEAVAPTQPDECVEVAQADVEEHVQPPVVDEVVHEPVTVETRPTPEMEQFIHDAVAAAERIAVAGPLLLERAEMRVRAALARAAAAAVPAGRAPAHAGARTTPAAPSGTPGVAASPARTGGNPGVSRGPAPAFGNVAPRYPESARREGKEGTVLVHVSIDANGLVSSCELALTSGVEALDNEAISTVKLWRFTPAMADGVAVASEADVPVVFRLRP